VQRVKVIDSHTGGEPTRVVVAGGPDLGDGSLAGRREIFKTDFDLFRSGIVLEPRGSNVLVGALLVPAHEPGCIAGVIFFNNIGTIGMCGHGTMGLVVTLAHMGRIGPGSYRIDTPVGVVGVEYHGGSKVTVENVASHRLLPHVRVDVGGIGPVVGDVAWGGNWFFLTDAAGLPLNVANANRLTDYTQRVKQSLIRQRVAEADGGQIDHIELIGPPVDPRNNARNFVLCPGNAYDRSPCGTGTSAKLACLAADGKLRPREIWRQESVTGSVFEGWYEIAEEGKVRPFISGDAFLTAEAELCFDPADPLRAGVRP
jgi:4-hydroxyproline epimerase